MRASALLLLTACDVLKPSSDVTAACETKTYGYTAPTASAQEALEQTNCYRNLMGLSRGKLNAQLDDAAQLIELLMHNQDVALACAAIDAYVMLYRLEPSAERWEHFVTDPLEAPPDELKTYIYVPIER